jgi:hypothetical protein
MTKLDPAALAEWDDEQGASPDEIRPGVQPVDAHMIAAFVVDAEELPWESARPFGEWLDGVWNDYTDPDDPTQTNGDVISGALAYWRGQ